MNRNSFLTTALFFFLSSIITLAHPMDKKGALLEFTQETIDVGTFYTDALEPVLLEIEFKNEGDEPLILSNVRGCCGTRIKEFPKNPILPGEKGTVEIEFRLTPRPHNINRTVSIMSNDTRGLRVCRIQGVVAEPEEAVFGAQKNTPGGPRVP
jgi:hypothetical protein